MPGTYSPNPALQFLDNNGDPAASYQLFTYLAGTSTKQATYTDVNLQTANANPIVLDANGRCTIFLEPGVAYKFALATDTDTDPPASPVWTRDNVSGVPEDEIQGVVDGTAGEALAANDCVYLSAGDGGRTAGRWYKADADNDYSSSTADGLGFALSAIASGATGSIVRDGRMTGFSGLTAGTLYYISATAGAITSSAPTNKRAVAVADSTTSIVLLQSTQPNVWTNLPDASATVEGIVTTSDQTLGDGTKHFKEVPTFDPGDNNPVSATCRTLGIIAASLDTSQNGNVGTGEDTLISYSLPANTFYGTGAGIKICARGQYLGSSGTKTVTLKFGSTTLVTRAESTTTTGRWIINAEVWVTGASAQKAWGKFSSTQITSEIDTISTPAETITGAITIAVTGETTNASNDEVTCEFFWVEAI